MYITGVVWQIHFNAYGVHSNSKVPCIVDPLMWCASPLAVQEGWRMAQFHGQDWLIRPRQVCWLGARPGLRHETKLLNASAAETLHQWQQYAETLARSWPSRRPAGAFPLGQSLDGWSDAPTTRNCRAAPCPAGRLIRHQLDGTWPPAAST